MVSKEDIEKAYNKISGQIVNTPLTFSYTISDLCECKTFFKLENFQMTGSFKERGALNKLLNLSAKEKKKGVISASAGNHAQAVAYHGQRLGIKIKIVMPIGTPLIKVVSTQNYGANVILYGESYDDAYEHALELSKQEGLILVHPFNDPFIIAGQGTLGIEILNNKIGKEIDAIVCPVGGGGLISGIATYIKETKPSIKVIGIQTASCPSTIKALENNKPIRLETSSSLADGIVVKKVGELTFEIVKKYVDEMVTVEEDEIANAVLLLLEIEKIVVEGAGAVSLAALINKKINLKNKKVLSIISGGNIDVNILNRIITQGLSVDGRIAQLKVRVLDKPGALNKILTIIAKLNANVLDIIHNRFDSAVHFGYVDISITLETKGHKHIEEIKQALKKECHLI